VKQARKHRKWPVQCPNCEEEFEVGFEPGSPGNTYGPPERCYEAEPSFYDIPEDCPECGESFSKQDIERMEERADEEMKGYCDDDRY